MTGTSWFAATILLASTASLSATGPPVRLADKGGVTELSAGAYELVEIPAAPYPRLLTIDEGKANIEIAFSDGEGGWVTVDNGAGRGSREWLHLPAEQPQRLRVVHTDGPGAAVSVGLGLARLSPKASKFWQRLDRVFFSTADRTTALETLATALESPLLVSADKNQLRFSLALRFVSVGRLEEAAEHLLALNQIFTGDWRARTWVDLAQISFRQGDLETAKQRLQQANAVAKQAGAMWTELVSAGNLCRLLQAQGELAAARDCTQTAIARAGTANDPKVGASLLFNLGGLEVGLANPMAARAAFEEALVFFKKSGDLRGQGNVASALALLERRLGHLQRALALQATALDAFRRVDDRRRIALATSNLAGLYLSTGNAERARPLVEESAALGQELNDLRQWRRAIGMLSFLEYEGMNYERAEIYRRQALSLAQEVNSQPLILADRLNLADALFAQQRFDEAAIQLSEVEDNLAAAPNLTGTLLGLKGRLLLKQGAIADARATLSEAWQITQQSDNRVAELSNLVTLTKLELRERNYSAATKWVNNARQLIEARQLPFNNPSLRLPFSRAFSQIAELELRTLVATGASDVVRRSFITAERNRARMLIELLSRTDATPPVPEAELQQQLTVWQERLALTRVQLEAAHQFDPGQVGPLTATVRELRQEIELAEARVADGYPLFPAFSVPDLDIANLQAQLEPDTWLIEFSLADDNSLAWRLTAERIELFKLAPRQQLEALARDVHKNMNPPRSQALVEQRLAELGNALFAPFADEQPPAKLLLVADGALHYVPFAAVPWPGHSRPLIEVTEIVHLASAQAALLQRQIKAEDSPEKTLLIIADPVFDGTDRRLPNPHKDPGLNLSRLTQSRDEAQQIAALIEPDEVDVWLDFTANRENLLNTNLRRYKMLHLATHASSDSAFPELSGLTLSTMDANGGAINGFVGLRDLFRLQGSADLVVLSACDTALGSEVRGEGLVGLTRGFLYAGARQVIGTLWPVEDRTNTALMLELYKAILGEGASTSAALRAAQRAIRSQQGRSHPFYWSGVALYGDWQ